MAKTAADIAYAKAVKLVEKVRREGETAISFGTAEFRALEQIPKGLAATKGLLFIDLNGTNVSDLSPLSRLTSLQTLWLNHTRVSDISPLARLNGLTHLWLDDTPITDLSPIANLTSLVNLSLNQTFVSDISPLAKLTAMAMLWLSDTKVRNLDPLSAMLDLEELKIDGTYVNDLAPLSGLAMLETLVLDNTGVNDLAPLTTLRALRRLSFNFTKVSDLASLVELSKIDDIWLIQTQVSDLRPICHSRFDDTLPWDGLFFSDTPATRLDPELARLAAIEDTKDRTQQTLAYLKTLPPWPEPLPWLQAAVAGPPPPTPEPDGGLNIDPTDTGIDLAHSPIDALDLADPIKKRIYAKLPEAVAALARHGNRFVEVKGPADALKILVAVPFEEADLLDIHLQIAALTDVRELDAHKAIAERLDADCLTALNTVLRLGPPVTLGHPDVDLLEKKAADYARVRLPATVPEGERRMAAGVAANREIVGDRLRAVAGQVAVAPDQGRVAEIRRSLHRNTVLALAYVAGAVGDAATGFVFGEVTVHAAQFLVLHKDAIMATAPAWGETGYRWLEYMLARAQQIIEEARRK